MAGETIAIFDGLELTADEARRAVRAHAGADVIWEWRSGKDDSTEQATSADIERGTTCHAGVTARTGDEPVHQIVGQGATPRDALADLLWDVVLDAMLAEDAPMPLLAGEPALDDRDAAAKGPRRTGAATAVRIRRRSEGPSPASCG